MRYSLRLLAAICCTLAGLQAAHAERRLALAVGIDVYDNLPAAEQLQKAVNDARAMGTALRALGFEATVEENVPRLAFTRAWQKFLNRLEPGDTAALFFAGHGVEIGGLNYLLPRDVPGVVAGEDRVLAEASIRFNTLMDDLRDKKVRIALFIVDACRDNPFRDGSGRSVGGTRGLARIEPAEGSFVMYSAGAGEQALDRLPGADRDPNSVYTRTLLPILAAPGLSLQDVAIRVRRQVVEVARSAGRKQTPAYYDQLVGNFVLKASAAADAKPAAVPTPVPLSTADRMWAVVKDTTSILALEAFRQQYGKEHPVYDRLAEARIEELKKRKVAVAMPPPVAVPPKVIEPAVLAPDPAATPGRVFRDCDECPEMVVVPAGSFMMGSSPAEIAALERETKIKHRSEGPQRQVTIAKPFAVGRFEVTFAEWDACVAAGGCRHRPGDEGWGRGRRPVINVSWNDVTGDYLPWLSRRTGKTYRLLSEAEWEYAARAGTATPFATGRTITRAQANFISAMGRGTVDVGSFQPNPFGLHDMHGNVWEMVQDCWNGSYSGAPSDGSAWRTGDCGWRVGRGGAHFNAPESLRSASRGIDFPNARNNGSGFRVGRTL